MSTAHDSTAFERERDKLVAEIAENLGKCVTAVNQLNRNIEDVTSVDGGFSAVYSTWSRFQRALETGSYADSDQPPVEILARDNDETVRLPVGIAPGRGETVLRPPTAAAPASSDQ
ncbi:hypothetical protein JCM8115_002701 [Rhodotorula mucilaginosa]|uniref:DASH complex subunit DAD1 n=1 Tax=Rhodotorula mucilaginosa TaxID=5537 RepID=A0A9P6W3N1_RHOMI|nr:hypothetical protein C6P46_004047 [Rhodotorula mucilaginosa]